MVIDLHTHSHRSDGTDSPAQLVAAGAAAGLDVMALCDHDTTSGWEEAAAALPPGLALVRGIEISCTVGGISVHLLAYLPDLAHAGLAEQLRLVREGRLPRLQRMVARMAADAIPVTWEQVEAGLTDGATAGRPHIADALVHAGVVPHRDDAFSGILASSGPYYEPHYAIPAVNAVRLVRAAGGVPVVAHPAASDRGRTVSAETLRELAASGLAGLEVDHRDNPPAAREWLRALADELGLFVTGASDYHGSGKRNRLGENTTSPDVLQAILDQARSGVEVIRTRR